MERLACEGDDFVPPKIMVRDEYFNDVQIIQSNAHFNEVILPHSLVNADVFQTLHL